MMHSYCYIDCVYYYSAETGYEGGSLRFQIQRDGLSIL